MRLHIHTHLYNDSKSKQDTKVDVSYTQRKHLRQPPQRVRRPGMVSMTREQVKRLYVHVCICVCTYVRRPRMVSTTRGQVNACICMYVYICVCMYVCVQTRNGFYDKRTGKRLYMYAFVYVCIYVCVCMYEVYVNIHTYIHTYTHTYVYVYVHTHTYIYTHGQVVTVKPSDCEQYRQR